MYICPLITFKNLLFIKFALRLSCLCNSQKYMFGKVCLLQSLLIILMNLNFTMMMFVFITTILKRKCCIRKTQSKYAIWGIYWILFFSSNKRCYILVDIFTIFLPSQHFSVVLFHLFLFPVVLVWLFISSSLIIEIT